MPNMFKQMKINNNELVEKAAECLGNLAKAGGSITAEVVEKNLEVVINWLEQDKNAKSSDIKKYSAVLLLKEFCKKLPIMTFNKLFDTKDSYKHIFQAFRDNRVHVRDTAAECINNCLNLIYERDQKSSQYMIGQIYNEVQVAFTENDQNYQYSALTVLSAIISNKSGNNNLLNVTINFDIVQDQGLRIIENVMKLHDHTKSVIVKKKCIEIMPLLVKHIPNHFREFHLEQIIKSIFQFISKRENKERGQGFISLGKLSLLVPKLKYLKFMPEIFASIDKEIQQSKQPNSKFQAPIEVLTCIKMILKNFGEEYEKKVDIVQFTNDIFFSGFNKQLIETLAELAKICEGKYKTITQIKLLNAIFIILTQIGTCFPLSTDLLRRPRPHHSSTQSLLSSSSPSGKSDKDNQQLTPRRNESIESNNFLIPDGEEEMKQGVNQEAIERFNRQVSRSPNVLKIDYSVLKKLVNRQSADYILSLVQPQNPQQQQDQQFIQQKNQLVCLALKTLASYDFTEFSDSVTQFIEQTVLNFLDDENPEVRKEAVKTCCSLSFSTSDGMSRLGAVMKRMVTKLLHKFFVTATTDSDCRIRCTMLKYLNKQFDPFISTYENLLMLFNCMQDTNFDIKDRTIRILGRLVPHNPSHILPYLRHQIVSLINQLEITQDLKEREETAKLIKTFVRYNKEISKAYSTSILKCLIQKIDGEHVTSGFISSVLEAIGEISIVDNESVKPYIGDLFPVIIECIKDQSSPQKREVAIKTLTQLAENTGFVIKPYFFFPEIINQITYLIQNEQQLSIKKLVLKLIGTLGAIDPYLVKQIQSFYSSTEGNDRSDAYSNIQILQMIDEQLDSNADPELQTHKQDDQIQTNIFKKKFRKGSDLLSSDNTQKEVIIMNQVVIKESNIKQFMKQYNFQETKENKYSAKAIEHLVKVLIDPTLRDHHQIVLQGIKYIVFNLGSDSIMFLPLIIPPIMILIQQNDQGLTESLYQCINAIIGTVPKSIDKFSDIIVETINAVLITQSMQVLELIKLLNINCKDNLQTEMFLLLPKILQLIETKRIEDIDISTKSTQTLREFHIKILNDYLYIIVPLLLRICSNGIGNKEIQHNIEIIKTIDILKNCSNFREHVAQIVHSLLQIIETQSQHQQFIQEILKLFCSIARKLSIDFAPYIPLIQKSLKRNKLSFETFDDTIESVVRVHPTNLFYNSLVDSQMEEQERIFNLSGANSPTSPSIPKKSMIEAQEIRKKHISFEVLLREFDTSKCSIEADWVEWLKKTSYQLLKQSPSPILYACSTLAEVYAPIANELYNIAFVSCWKIMSDKIKEKIMENYLSAIRSRSKPTAVLQTILNLAEFMELDENTDIKLFSSKTLADIAEQCNAYAKALYYWEQEFENDPKTTIQVLIQTNYGLQQPEAAEGILEYARKNMLIDEKEEWYEKLHRWRDALRIYEQKEIDDPNNFDIIKGKFNCFRNLYDWENLSYLVDIMWQQFSQFDGQEDQGKNKEMQEIAEYGSYSAWNLGDWDNFQKYVKKIDVHKQPYEKNFYQAILNIRGNKFSEAQRHIDKARDILEPKVTSLLGESYNRAYKLVQEFQILKELEEVIDYKSHSNESHRQHLYDLWCKRLEYQPTQDLEMWQKSLNIRSLVIDKSEEIDFYLKFASLAQECNNNDLGQKILLNLKSELMNKKRLQKSSNLNNQLAKVEFAVQQTIFNSGLCQDAITSLSNMIKEKDDLEPDLRSKCYLKLGMWHFDQQEINKVILTEEDYKIIISNCEKATQISPTNQEAWHYYSVMNYEASIFYSKLFSEEVKGQPFSHDTLSVPHYVFDDFVPQSLYQIQQMHSSATSQGKAIGQKYVMHVVQAMKGLVQQLSLSGEMHYADMTKTLQNILRLIKLWYRHGNLENIEQIVRDSFEQIDLKIWINVIPQLLARVDIQDPIIRKSLIDLLEKISQKFPQALIYSLSVLQKSRTKERKKAADQLIQKLRQRQPLLIEQATMISNELIRSAIVLCEIWTEVIEEASRIYFGQNDPKAMIKYLEPYHRMMEQEPETLNEIAFYQGFASDLFEAESWAKKYLQTQDQNDINQAWGKYLSIFRDVQPKSKDAQFYELKNIAPKLLESENLAIAVPGTFKCDKKIIKIQKFSSVLQVLSSKQHPRKLQIYGSDGKEYMFLLKGHEDIRQDERVMQFFGLVNTLLSIDPQTSKKDLYIRRYPIIPLSQNSGLLGWVPNCDTFHLLIKEHRSQANIIPNIEYKLMESMCSTFDQCPLPHKVEIFRYALDRTMGEDLQKVLWLKSLNSELWLERRTNYTRSLAVMSMVGYILGLGDRHPSNIMLDRYSGKIIHIDFGDCFEIAMRREKYPEKIPFRLTRMLIKAMEVSGIEGNFRTTCENTMRVMRAGKDSLLAILEAFVYDPLISFKLLNPKLIKQQQQQKNNEQEQQQNDKRSNDEKIESLISSSKKKQQSIREQFGENILDKYTKPNANKDEVKENYAESKFSRIMEQQEIMQIIEEEGEDARREELNQTAEIVIKRISDKLRGQEIHHGEKMDIESQVDHLIKQATSHENLAQCYMGWCPFW